VLGKTTLRILEIKKVVMTFHDIQVTATMGIQNSGITSEISQVGTKN
jgi:hypothetical protein